MYIYRLCRGIDVVREKIKHFAQVVVARMPKGAHKVVLLDEADSMTAAAQQALRRIMEQYSETTRFVFACNNSSKLIEPIQSRTVVYRFEPLSDAQLMAGVVRILDAERATYDEGGLQALVFTASGDMRHAVNNAQTTVVAFGAVTRQHVYSVCDVPNPRIVRELIVCCAYAEVDEALQRLNALWRSGHAAEDLIKTMFQVLARHSSKALLEHGVAPNLEAALTLVADKKLIAIPEDVRLEFLKLIGTYQVCIADGLTTRVQLRGCVADMCRVVAPRVDSGGLELAM